MASRIRDLETLYPSRATGFAERVAAIVKKIPRGQTMAYSSIASLAGRPGGARAVTRVLHSVKGLPWWRVIRRDGTLALEVAHEQSKHLRKEGVRIEGRRVVPQGKKK